MFEMHVKLLNQVEVFGLEKVKFMLLYFELLNDRPCFGRGGVAVGGGGGDGYISIHHNKSVLKVIQL